MIDYHKIADALNYYAQYGYKYIEVPWAVSLDAINITCPANCVQYSLENKYLVASAEQSFLQMILDQKLNLGKYLAVTPCFRDDVLSETHQRYFMKVELIDFLPKSENLNEILSVCLQFYRKYLPVVKVETPAGYDINSFPDGVELGSYGLRTATTSKIGSFSWIYGTGVAEPRLSYAISKM